MRSADDSRIDSCVIAERLGVKHKHSFALVTLYQARFEALGQLPFETEVGKRAQDGGGYAARR